MTATAITNVEIKKDTPVALTAPSAVATDTAVDTYVGNTTPSQYALVDMSGVSDERFLLVVENAHVSADKKVYIYPTDGYGNKGMLEKTITHSATMGFVIDSANYKQMSGDYRGKIIVGGETTDIKVAAYKLP